MRDDCTGIEGMEAEEAEALIAALADHIVKPAFIYRHQWRPGDLLIWDNCTVQHRAVQDYDLPRRRLMCRTTMGGAVYDLGLSDATDGETASGRSDGVLPPRRSRLSLGWASRPHGVATVAQGIARRPRSGTGRWRRRRRRGD